MKVDFRYLIFASLLFYLPVENYCQKILDPEYVPPNVRWDNFPVNNGEASQTSLSILIDKKGFLWSGTKSGLYRYDGARYVEYSVTSGNEKGFKGFDVNAIFEDSEGTIWIGTSEALNKLDQNKGTFSHYIPDSIQIHEFSNFIRAIREDRDELLWVLTKKDIFSFDRKREKFTQYSVDTISWYPLKYDFPSEDQCFTEDKLGNKWFVTYKGLYIFNNHDKTFRQVLPDQSSGEFKDLKRVRCVDTDKNGILWIGTEGEGLLRWNYILNKPEKINIRTTEKYRDSFTAVSAIATAKNGSVWCFGNGTFSNYNPEDKSIKTYILNYKYRTQYEYPGSEVWIDQIFQSEDGILWFLNKMAGLMFRFDPAEEELSLYRSPIFAVYQCLMDNTGSFWFACSRNNIFRLVTCGVPFFTVYYVNNTSNVAQTHRGTILEDNQNNIYFLFLYGIQTCKNFDISSSLELRQFRFPDGDNSAGGGFTDSRGNLWFGDKKGNVTRYDPLTKRLETLTNNKSLNYSEIVIAPLVREDKNGNLWIATSKGLSRIDKGNDRVDHILDFTYKSGNKNFKILLDFLIDSRDHFWILTSESLLEVEMPEMRIKDYTEYEGGIFSSSYTNIRVGEDSGGNLFILNSRSGLHRFNSQNSSFERVEIISREEILEYYDLLVDRSDRLWVANNRGIAIYDQLNKSSRLIKTPKLQYDVQSYQLKSGYIIFLNNDQLYIFNEKNIAFNNYIPPVYLTRLLIDGKDYNSIFPNSSNVSSVKKIILPFRLNTLSIEFAALNYLNPEKNRYRYYMHGLDRDTSYTGQGLPAEYRNMPPGHYTFSVTGSNNDGIWNPSGTALDIIIKPPWYRSVVAYLIYLFSILIFIGVYIRMRTRQLRRDKIKLETEVEMRTAQLEHANRQLAEVDRIKTHFFTDISHEIRTPLSLIIGPLEHLSVDETLSGRMAAMVDIMKRNARRLMHLVNQLLDISRLDAGKMRISLCEGDIVKCLRILVYEFLSYAESKNIKYIADLPDGSFITWFDRDKIEKITTNLLSNAFKYTPENGTVHCIVRIDNDGNNNPGPSLCLKIADTGTGISREHQNRIFDRFYRIEEQHEKNGRGTGIGLSIVSEFVSLLHGEIKVESVQGKGSDFSVIIPLGKNHLSADEFVVAQQLSIATEQEITFLIDNPSEISSYKKANKGKSSLLLIEDNADLRNFIKESFSDKYHVHESDNGRSGINTAFTMMPDIIVTDIMMPDLDGIELCRQLKNDERTSHIPVIMLTAKATTEDRVTGLKSGADDYIVKPFSMSELETRITNLLSIREKLKKKYSRFYTQSEGKQTSESVDDKFMNKVLDIINANLRDFSFDVANLQYQLGMSRTHLTRKLKILTGLSPGGLIRNIRLEKAAGMLKVKAGNITEVANSVGISNPSNFTKAFKKYFGVSPKNYAKP